VPSIVIFAIVIPKTYIIPININLRSILLPVGIAENRDIYSVIADFHLGYSVLHVERITRPMTLVITVIHP